MILATFEAGRRNRHDRKQARRGDTLKRAHIPGRDPDRCDCLQAHVQDSVSVSGDGGPTDGSFVNVCIGRGAGLIEVTGKLGASNVEGQSLSAATSPSRRATTCEVQARHLGVSECNLLRKDSVNEHTGTTQQIMSPEPQLATLRSSMQVPCPRSGKKPPIALEIRCGWS